MERVAMSVRRKSGEVAKKARSATGPTAAASLDSQLRDAMAWLEDHSSEATRDSMARYAIPSDNALGVAMRDIKALGKALGRNHELAMALWGTGVYEARMLASFVGDPARLTSAEMDRWCKDFDNWGLCDTLCFNLFDQTPHAWTKVAQWSSKRREFEKRTAFALLWSLSVHDKQAGDERFVRGLALIEREATDDRHFVKKAVNMALRAVGKRNRALNTAAVAVATRLAGSKDPAAHWVGKDALRELTSPSVRKRVEKSN
jgi:3-methyladenine DNA glycosylase AlkD